MNVKPECLLVTGVTAGITQSQTKRGFLRRYVSFGKSVTMKINVSALLLLVCMQLSATSLSQTINVRVDNQSLTKVFEMIEAQTGYYVVYNTKIASTAKPVTISATDMPLVQFLDRVLKSQSLDYTIDDKTILVTQAPQGQLLTSQPTVAEQQQREITGRVTDTDNVPLEGVTVTLRGTTQAVITNADGYYSISGPATGSVLVFTMIGFDSQVVTVQTTSIVNVVLVQTVDNIETVVVTGYGVTRREAFTGSASVVTNAQIKDQQATSITDVLQGNASGVIAVANSGQPGVEPTIRVRGIGSFNASNSPLILLDGVPFTGSINSINPGDIESLTVLKDASSTSIYGSRAANGIIQIVTKKGKGAAKFDFSSILGASSRAVREYSTVNEQQYYELTWEALRNDAILNPTLLTSNSVSSPEEYATKVVPIRLAYNPFNVANPVGLDGKLVSGAQLRWDDDWMAEMVHTGIRKDMNASVSGSSSDNKLSYFVGGGYLGDQGIIADSEFKRYSGRLGLDAKITKWFSVGVNTSLSKSDQNFPYQGTEYASNVLSFARTIAPIYPIHLVDFTTGEYIRDGQGNKIYDFGNNSAVLGVLRPTPEVRLFNAGQNVAATTELNPNLFGRFTGNGTGYADVNFGHGLTFRSQYSVIFNNIQNDVFWNPFYGDGTTQGGYAYRGVSSLTSQNFTNSFTYDNTVGIHHINVVAGMEAFRQVVEGITASRTGFTFADPKQVSYGTISNASGNKNEYRLESYFGRANYDIADKYHLSLSLRTDGATRFSADHRWGVFYAVGTAWNMHEENFLKDNGVLSLLKLKASYGSSGNQALPGEFPYLGTYSAGANIGSASGSVINTVSNEILTWEKQNQLDLGIEFGFLNNRLTGSIVRFDRKSDALLFERPLPNSSGVDAIADNAGGVRNSGWEFDLTSYNITKTNFSWRTVFNITQLKNEITEIAPGTTQRLGGSWYDYFIKEYAGVDMTDGSPMWYMDDEQGEKVTTKVYGDATNYYIGNRLSDYTGGMTNFLRYGNFDLSVLASFAIGGKYYDSNYAGLMGGIKATGRNASTDLLNRWQSVENPGDGKTPKLLTISDNVVSSSTRFMYDRTYLRVRNVTLGYTLPQSLTQRIQVRNLRLYASSQNPLTFFGGPKGADPDAGINASASNNNSTTNKFISFGLNIGI